MPQPDILLLRPPIDRYRMRHPRPEGVLLAIEVAAWLADLPGEALEV